MEKEINPDFCEIVICKECQKKCVEDDIEFVERTGICYDCYMSKLFEKINDTENEILSSLLEVSFSVIENKENENENET